MEPGVSPFILLTARPLASLILLTPIGAIKARRSLVHSLTYPFKLFEFSTFFIAFGSIVYVMLTVVLCIRILPIVNVSIFMNMGPLITILLAVPILKEKISNFALV